MFKKEANAKIEEILSQQRRQAKERGAKKRAEKLDFPYLELATVPIQTKALGLISESEAREAKLASIQIRKKLIVLVVFDPADSKTKKIIERFQKDGYQTEIYVVSLESLEYAWKFYEYVAAKTKEITGKVEISSERIKELTQKLGGLKELKIFLDNFKDPYISQIFEVILAAALVNHASDIHLEPSRDRVRLRLRIDGLLYEAYDLTAYTYSSLVSRIKLLSKLKLNIHNQPQDGRFTINLEKGDIEIRTSVIPSEFGETIVLRVLDPALTKVNLEELGLRKDDFEIVSRELERPNGMILNTGPTGSGKTTTLYSFLRKIYQPEIKIITIEDPIEYHLGGIEQTQVNVKAGYTFANGLRSILRQDPDVILVGEIRDFDTAQIAIHAALTGHLVFSTLHTNEASGAIPRLIDLDIQPSVIAPAINLIIAQRLVRKICPACRKEKKIDSSLAQKIKKFVSQLPERINKTEFDNYKIFEAQGCSECNGLGYKGRLGVFEFFLITPEISSAIVKEITDLEIKKLARQQGMVYMQEDGIIKVLSGLTTFGEVERVTGPINFLD